MEFSARTSGKHKDGGSVLRPFKKLLINFFCWLHFLMKVDFWTRRLLKGEAKL